MKKMNKKGFTLIELLAVIVILAIIMVIAVPQILNVIDGSRDSAWKNNVKLIEEAIELNTSLAGTGMAEGSFTSLSDACTNAATILPTIADYDDTNISCTTEASSYKFSLTGEGQFDTKTATITCEASGCTSTIPAE